MVDDEVADWFAEQLQVEALAKQTGYCCNQAGTATGDNVSERDEAPAKEHHKGHGVGQRQSGKDASPGAPMPKRVWPKHQGSSGHQFGGESPRVRSKTALLGQKVMSDGRSISSSPEVIHEADDDDMRLTRHRHEPRHRRACSRNTSNRQVTFETASVSSRPSGGARKDTQRSKKEKHHNSNDNDDVSDSETDRADDPYDTGDKTTDADSSDDRQSKRRHRSRTSRRRDDYSSFSSDDDKEDDNDGYAPRRRRGRELKPRGFDGSGSFESFWAHFSNCAEYNRWNDADSLANLRQALTGEAAQLMWDSSHKEVDSLRKLTKLLRSHYGGSRQRARYLAELRLRRRRAGEELTTLHHDIRRLLALARPSLTRADRQVVGLDYFVEALNDPDFALKVREKMPKTLDSAARIAMQLETFQKEAERQRRQQDTTASRGKARKTATSNDDNALGAPDDDIEQLVNRFIDRRFGEIPKQTPVVTAQGTGSQDTSGKQKPSFRAKKT